MNPLNKPNTIFDLALMNPNPTSRKTKDGPNYRVSFEVERETWDWFMSAEETTGMVIAAKAAVVGDTAPQCEPITAKPKATGKGEHGKAWALLYKSGWWYCPDVWPLFGTDADYQAWCRSQPCAIPGIPCEGDIVAAHVRRIALGAGMGIKPDYTTIPMCDTAHTRYQHQHGESAVGGKEHLDKLLAQYRTEWMKSVIREMFAVESCSQIEPGRFGRWVAEQADGLAWASLPKEFKS